MANVKRFFRLNYAADATLESMIQSGTFVCSAPELVLTIRVGDGILLARFNESNQAGEVRALGIVTAVADSGASPRVDWIRVKENLYPSTQGMQFWRQPKPYFVFAASVVERYRLPEMFKRHFEREGRPVSPTGATATVGSVAGPGMQTEEGRSSQPTTTNDRGGYVYLILSPYGYKIGKTKRMKERSQLFSVKLPFEIEVVHYKWFEDYSRAEAALHQRFKEKRLDGEWFRLTPADVQAVKAFTL